ncbi:MAG TPA: bifunctional adenosylcobinamide kinase/adenosylcobinamide-phosphate guanylyltransferase [Candidatus Pelethocola excrementipullorum]|nr:bifunctional adenosylcobinamide kinase/adenosylcobinamide-phosphate guanylyltransferase [Candidatus Pelethocola excrementipullorum]
MFHVITGGSGSGKSVYAEGKILELGPAPRIYIATMYPFDEESHLRIERHRRMRAEKEFDTVECYTGLGSVQVPCNANVLLECMSNLAANEMFQPGGAGSGAVAEVMKGIRHLLGSCANLIVVTNEIFSDGIQYDEETRTYQSYLGEINVQMASMADHVTEVVYGIPIKIK